MIRAFVLLGAVLLATGCRNYEKQFEFMCTVAKEVQEEHGGGAVSGAQLYALWNDRVYAGVSGDAKSIIGAIGGTSIPGQKRYAILRQGADECGVPNYRCDAIEWIFMEAEKAHAQQQ